MNYSKEKSEGTEYLIVGSTAVNSNFGRSVFP